MKKVLILLMVFCFASCEQKTQNNLSVEKLQIQTALDNPCIECTEKVRAELAVCLKNAGSDKEKIRQCEAKASADWVSQCKAICNPRTESLAEETPRMKCLREAQEAHLKCNANAKTPQQKAACDKTLSEAIKVCPPPSPNK